MAQGKAIRKTLRLPLVAQDADAGRIGICDWDLEVGGLRLKAGKKREPGTRNRHPFAIRNLQLAGMLAT